MLATMVTAHPSHWRPASEAELRDALAEGAFTETTQREAKRELRSPKDQAKDMASFAVDGGLIVVGVDEDKETGKFSLSPIPFEDQICESAVRRAQTICDPPLQVTADWLPSDEVADHGYLLIEIPASPLAPHQAGGVYYGRGDKEKRRLSDGEIERLIRARDASLDSVRAVRHDRVAADPFPDGILAHMHVVAMPTRWVHGLFKEWTSANNPQPLLHHLVRNGISQETLERAGRGGRAAPDFNGLVVGFRSAGGVGIGTNPRSEGANERRDLRLIVRERGEVYLFCGRISDQPESMPNPVLFDGAVAFKTRALLDLLGVLSERSGYRGSWDVGVAVTNMRGVSRFTQDWELSDSEVYDEDTYERATRVSPVELRRPGSATDRLVGELLRSLGGGPAFRSLLSGEEDPTIE